MSQIVHVPSALAITDLAIPHGATFRAAFTYGEGKPPTKPVGWPDPAIWHCRARLAPDWGMRTIIATLRQPTAPEPRDGDALLDDYPDGTGLITLVVGAAVTATWTWKSAVWDLHIRHVPSGEVTRICEGLALMSTAAGDGQGA